ncbi:MAG: hypothetical protein LBM76_02470, partial [Mycoplasmataceae bacterium]|nr:hypothetical protein [Mycoplasmataceae bacterium]
MKKILMALTPILLIGGVTTGVICNNHETKIMQSPQRSIGIDNNEVTTTLNQKVYYDGEDANPDIDGSVTKPISFANKLKKIYLPNNLTNDISASDLLMEYHQSTAPTNDHKQCGYSNNNDNLSFEINERVQDWAQYYFAGLKIKANQFDNKMGLGILPLTLTDHKIWDKDTSYKTIDNPIAFEKDGVIPTVFNNAQEFNYIKGAHQNFENKLETITGAPFCYTKESQHSSGMKVWANRYLWTLQGVNGESSVGYSADSHPVCGVYSLDNLVSINGSSFKNKTITLGINNIMLE